MSRSLHNDPVAGSQPRTLAQYAAHDRKQISISRTSDLKAFYLGTLVSAIGYGISFPLISISLENMGLSGQLIGLNAAMPPLGWLIGSIFLPGLQRRFGLKPILIAFLLLACSATIGFSTTQAFWAWTVLRLLFGGGLGLFYRLCEFYINHVSPNHERGKNIGIYAVCFMLGIAIGSSIQPLFGTHGFASYAVIFGLLVIAGGLITLHPFPRLDEVETDEYRLNFAVLLVSPIAFLSILSYGLFENIPAYLLSVYALRNGLSESIAAYTLTAAAIGNILFPVPLGLASDRLGRFVILLACAGGAAAVATILPIALSVPSLFLALVLVWWGLAGGMYNIALAEIGDKCSGHTLVLANASFGIVYSMGSLVGPILNGMAIDTLASQGLMISAAATFCFFILAAVMLKKREVAAYGHGKEAA